MHNKVPVRKMRITKPVREARAGLIPASDDIADERRAQVRCAVRIVRAARAYVRAGRCASESQKIVEILAGVRHYCDWKGLLFEELNEVAHIQWLEEAGCTTDLASLRETEANDAPNVSTALEDRVKERFPQIFRVTIHPEPVEES